MKSALLILAICLAFALVNGRNAQKYTNFARSFALIYNLDKYCICCSCQKSEPVCRFELTDFIENHVVYDGHRLFEATLEHKCQIYTADVARKWFWSGI